MGQFREIESLRAPASEREMLFFVTVSEVEMLFFVTVRGREKERESETEFLFCALFPPPAKLPMIHGVRVFSAYFDNGTINMYFSNFLHPFRDCSVSIGCLLTRQHPFPVPRPIFSPSD